MQSHEDLEVWKKAVDLCTALYRVTDGFPKQEIYGLTSQIRRAAVSVPSNIAEGRRRGTDADFKHFLHMAHGSLAEVETQIAIGKELTFCATGDYERLRTQIAEVSKMLRAMIRALR